MVQLVVKAVRDSSRETSENNLAINAVITWNVKLPGMQETDVNTVDSRSALQGE